MNRVLIISYFYPPYPTVGSLRAARLARHLPHFGWEPHILTAKIPGHERKEPNLVETEYRDILSEWKVRLHLDGHDSLRKQLHLPLPSSPDSTRWHTRLVEDIKTVFAFPDAMKGWIPFANEAVDTLARENRFEAILSSSPPISCHVIAARAHSILRCPWIADFRDLWDGGRFARLYERSLLRHAQALVTVSGPLADNLRDRYAGKTVAAITNSFEANEAPNTNPPRSPLTISYTGTLYHGKRDPSVLLMTLKSMLDDGSLSVSDVRLQFFGAQEPFLHSLIDSLGLRSVVTVHDRVSHLEALKLQAESHLLLLLDWNDVACRGIYTAKVFEYLAAGRPILALGLQREGVIPELLHETGAGIYLTPRDDLRQYLLKCSQQLKSDGEVPYHGNRAIISRYDSRTMSEKFAALLDAVHLPWSHASNDQVPAGYVL